MVYQTKRYCFVYPFDPSFIVDRHKLRAVCTLTNNSDDLEEYMGDTGLRNGAIYFETR